MAKKRKVLGVARDSSYHNSFKIIIDKMRTSTLDYNVVTWVIDPSAEETTIIITRWRRVEGKRTSEIDRARIVGPRDHIENILLSIGMGLPKCAINQPEESDWLSDIAKAHISTAKPPKK